MNKHACVNKPTYNFSGKPYPLFFTHWVTRMSIGNTIRWGMGNVCISVWALTAWVVNHFPISTHTFFFVKKKCPYPILNVVYWQINYSSCSFTLFGWLWLVAGGWWLVLICCERKVLLTGWWLVLIWCERKVPLLVADRIEYRCWLLDVTFDHSYYP